MPTRIALNEFGAAAGRLQARGLKLVLFDSRLSPGSLGYGGQSQDNANSVKDPQNPVSLVSYSWRPWSIRVRAGGGA